ncbi:hypothetical protein CAEBREN_08301 [Caenorhabditis brenneri]|uniref:Uncharacterized protein n=1 Tax=Caenorhabditis brenneri TaxID=135651 RepID=G0NZQ4_CAEBE|nr:hypothetical protein CAEBREN_08301 [Caenorhabditis brenneri]
MSNLPDVVKDCIEREKEGRLKTHSTTAPDIVRNTVKPQAQKASEEDNSGFDFLPELEDVTIPYGSHYSDEEDDFVKLQ